MNTILNRDKSCGALLFIRKDAKILWLVLQANSNHGEHWDFPKGHVENNESEIETANREVYEECGLKFNRIDAFREVITFVPKNSIIKDVIFFLGEAQSFEVRFVLDEMQDHAWLEYDDAIKRLTFENSKELLTKANEFISNLPQYHQFFHKD